LPADSAGRADDKGTGPSAPERKAPRTRDRKRGALPCGNDRPPRKRTVFGVGGPNAAGKFFPPPLPELHPNGQNRRSPLAIHVLQNKLLRKPGSET